MAYATGTAATVDALMSAVMSFAVSDAGMTLAVSRTETISSASWEVRCLSKGSSYWWFRWKVNDVYGMPATADTGATWATVTGRPTNDSRLWPIIAPFISYHLFTEGTVVHVAVEQASSAFQHFNFGDMTKYGTWTGGHYVGMSYQYWASSTTHLTGLAATNYLSACGFNQMSGQGADTAANGAFSYLYAPHVSRNYAASWQGPSGSTYNKVAYWGYMDGGSSSEGWASALLDAGPNVFNGRAPGLRMEAMMKDRGGTSLYLPLGYIPNIRFINMENLAPLDLVNTDWMVFPLSKKGLVGVHNTYVGSGTYGWAVKK